MTTGGGYVCANADLTEWLREFAQSEAPMHATERLLAIAAWLDEMVTEIEKRPHASIDDTLLPDIIKKYRATP